MSSLEDKEKKSLVKNASVVAFGTLISRIFGLIRDQVTAFYFGAGPVADAFFVAFRIPNLLRRLLAEGALTPAFVPIFSARLEEKGLINASSLYKGAFTLMALLLIAITTLGIIFSPELVRLMAPGFADIPEQYHLTVLLTRLLFPYILLMSLTALAMGALNSLGQFHIPALGPVALNISMIIGSVLISPNLKTPILGLAFGALLGGVLQLAIQLPYLKKAGPFLGISFDFRDPGISKMLSLMIPAALGAAAYQISIFINTLLASLLPTGSVSFLYYADRLMQFPLGVFSLALATAVLPALAKKGAAGDIEGFRETLNSALGLQFFITLPAMIGLMVMANPLVTILFERGQFDAESTKATAMALWAYVLGLPFLSGTSLAARAFYSLSDTKTPAKVASICLILGLIFAFGLMWPLKHTGLALASSLASIANFIWLMLLIRKQQNFPLKPLLLEIRRFSLWALIMGLILWPLYHSPSFINSGPLWRIIVGLIVGPLLFFALALYFKCPHLGPLRQIAEKITKKTRIK